MYFLCRIVSTNTVSFSLEKSTGANSTQLDPLYNGEAVATHFFGPEMISGALDFFQEVAPPFDFLLQKQIFSGTFCSGVRSGRMMGAWRMFKRPWSSSGPFFLSCHQGGMIDR